MAAVCVSAASRCLHILEPGASPSSSSVSRARPETCVASLQLKRGGSALRQGAIAARRASCRVRCAAEPVGAEQLQADKAADVSGEGAPSYKHILAPVMDRNPFLSESTRQALSTVTALARKNSSDITVVVIDEDQTENAENHKQRLDSIRFHMGEGGFEEFKLLEMLGEGKMPAAVVGELADDLGLDLVVLPMEAVHHKHIDANLLAEFVPCPVLLLPL